MDNINAARPRTDPDVLPILFTPRLDKGGNFSISENPNTTINVKDNVQAIEKTAPRSAREMLEALAKRFGFSLKYPNETLYYQINDNSTVYLLDEDGQHVVVNSTMLKHLKGNATNITAVEDLADIIVSNGNASEVVVNRNRTLAENVVSPENNATESPKLKTTTSKKVA